jgi:mannosyltransferase
VGLGVGAVGAGVAVRFMCRSPLWLDEAQTLAIAKRPLTALPGALRHDGAPPLYYALLHLWVRIFGGGTVAVRTLSGLISVLTLPVVWAVGRQLCGRRAAAAATLLMACSPFGIFFATETRMYALSMLLSLLGLLALLRVVERATWANASALAVATAALLLTHYWNVFVVAGGTLVVAVAAARRAVDRRAAAKALGGVGVGVALFLPCLPLLLLQLGHTGTPWAAPPTVATLARSFADWSAPAQTVVFDGLPAASYAAAIALAVVSFLLCVAAVTRTRDGRAAQPSARTAGVVAAALTALALAAVTSWVAGGGYEPRYTASVFALVVVVVGIGIARLPARTARIVLAGVCVVGLSSSALAMGASTKTEAGVIAGVIRASAHPGDVVVYCPDQLGPAVSRLLPDSLTQLAFPAGPSVATVDWVDYAKRNAQASPAAFATRVDRVAARGAIWLVDVPHGYATFGNKCGELGAMLASGRVSTLLVPALPHSYYEFANLTALTREPAR